MYLREWYDKREILVTGVTTELGRNLLEKLLRCFPGIKVHLVLRSRFGMGHADRIKKKILSMPGYERLHQERPDAASRIVTYEGNLTYEDLGVRPADLKNMANVSVVLHTGGTYKEVLKFCKELPKLKVVVAVDSIFRCEEDQIIENALKEDLPYDLPLALVRLPAVGPAYREPMPGYVEVLKGPTAMMVGAGYVLGRDDLPVEIIPVDLATNTIIAAAWDIDTRDIQSNEPIVYNCSTLHCTWGELIRKGDRANRKFPYPTFKVRGITSLAILHWIIVFLFEWLPSAVCDIFLHICWSKKRILPEHKRIRSILKSFEPVTCRAMTVTRRKVHELQNRLNPEDLESFPIRAVDIDIEAYILCAAAATRKYCVDEGNLRIVRFFLPTLLAILMLAVAFIFYHDLWL